MFMFMSSLVTTFLSTTFLACDNISLGAGRHRQNSFSCRKTKVMKDEGHIITDARSVSSKLIRRKILSAFALSLCTIVNKACANDEQILIECKNGSVASESAVPGAYQQQCFDLLQRTFILESTNDKIVIEQGSSSTRGVAGRTGVAVWNSGILLTRLLDKLSQMDQSFLKEKVVLELGCGVALASIAAEKLGASRVMATDSNEEVLALALRNIKHNNVSNVKAFALQWGLLDAFEFEETADLIIGSDLTYNPNTWRSLAESIATILKAGGMVIYLSLGHSGFSVDGELDGFTSVAENVGLQKVRSKAIESLLPQLLSGDEQWWSQSYDSRKEMNLSIRY